jgi:hypothetical protein
MMSVTCFVPSQQSASFLLERGWDLRRTRPDGSVSVVLPVVSFAPAHAGERQELFESALVDFRARLASDGIDAHFLSERGASLKIYITMSPVGGFVDLFLYPRLINLWSDLEVAYHFDVIAPKR